VSRQAGAALASAEAQVAAARDDPAARLALVERTYHGPTGHAPQHLPFRRAALSFMRWQAHRGVLNPLDSSPPGSLWWRAVNVDRYIGDEQRLGRLLDYSVILPRLQRMYEWSARELGEPRLLELVREGSPIYAWPFEQRHVWRASHMPPVDRHSSGSPERDERSGRSERVEGRCGDDAFSTAGQFGVQSDERIRLQLRQRQVLRVVGLRPSEPVGDVPGVAAENCVAEQADRHRLDAVEPLSGDLGRDLAAIHCLVKGGQRLRAKERRRKQLVLGGNLNPLTCKPKDNAAVDD
jgi:hypothetical protein